MTATVTLSTDRNSLHVSGVLNFDNALAIRDLGLTLLPQVQQPLFDLAEVTRCDSAALALLTAWARAAKATGKSARFIHLPAQLLDIARLSNLDKVLTLEANV